MYFNSFKSKREGVKRQSLERERERETGLDRDMTLKCSDSNAGPYFVLDMLKRVEHFLIFYLIWIYVCIHLVTMINLHLVEAKNGILAFLACG